MSSLFPSAPVRRRSPKPPLLCLFALVLAASSSLAQQVTHLWKGGTGSWDDSARWGGEPFDRRDNATVEGDGRVAYSHGDVTLNQLDVGSFHQAQAAVVMEGGALAFTKFLRIGELTGASGQFTQEGGDLRAFEIFIAAANTGNGSDRHAVGELEVRGGSMLTRHLTLGWGIGSNGTLRIVGSKARPIIVLDYFWVGVREQNSGPSRTEVSYQIDAEGVTPIVVWNPKSSAIALIDKAARSTCRLRVSLLEAPPRGDIPLLRLPRPCSGTFTDLPEGSAVRAEHAGQSYEWTITYHGGPAKSDVVLTQAEIIGADGARSPYTAGQPAKSFEVTAAEIDDGLRELLQRESAGQAAVDQTALRAFPGAEGYGAFAKGGRGGRALFVTNLNDSGAGSLRAAIESKGARTVIFRVGGVINLKSALTVREPYLTIAGQTAPGDGICVRASNDIHADTFVLNQTHDVVVRFLRAQSGKSAGPAHYDDGGDCISVYDSRNFIIDHCSAHFGTDETLSVTGAADLYTVQWSVIAEGLNYEKHSMASLLGGGRCTWHHNLIAHTGSRNPRFAGEPICDFCNNVIYDWGSNTGAGSFLQVNYVGNYLRPGPSSRLKPLRFVSGDAVELRASLHASGNVMDGAPEITSDNSRGIDCAPNVLSADPLPTMPMPIDSAESALARVLAESGAVLPKRDAADLRVVDDVRNRTGKIIASQDEVGGWPPFALAEAAVIDTDQDGIPDGWEREHGLNPNDPDDAARTAPDGYTWLEKYLNELAAAR